MTNGNGKQRQQDALIEAVKGASAGKPIHGNAVARAVGLKGSVAVRKIINGLRKQGIPIASCSEGYWMATSMPELKWCIEELQGKVNSLQAAINGLRMARFGGISPAVVEDDDDPPFNFEDVF